MSVQSQEEARIGFFGGQFVTALLLLAVTLLLLSGEAGPVLDVVGGMATSGPLGLVLAALLGFLPPAAALWWGTLRQEGLPGRAPKDATRAGEAVAWLGVAMTAALFMAGTSLVLTEPSRWHASFTDTLAGAADVGTVTGASELGAVGTMLAPMLAGVLVLGPAVDLTRGRPDEARRGRVWPWVAAALWLAGGVAGVFRLVA